MLRSRTCRRRRRPKAARARRRARSRRGLAETYVRAHACSFLSLAFGLLDCTRVFETSIDTSTITKRNAQVTAAQLRKAQAAAEAGKNAAGAEEEEEEEGSLDGVAALVGLLPSGQGAAVAEDEGSSADGASVASGSSKGSRRMKGSGRGQGGKALAVGRCVFCKKEFKLCGALRWLC